MTTTTTPNLIDALTTALKAHHRAKTVSAGNGFENVDLERMADANLDYQDKNPALNMAPKSALGAEMEYARTAGLDNVKKATSARRMAEAKARRERNTAWEAIATAPGTPDPERMQDAWLVVLAMYPTIQKMTESKRRWAERYLGDALQDVAMAAIEKMATMLAKSDWDLSDLHVAAEAIAEQQRHQAAIVGDQAVDKAEKAEKRERKALSRNRKLLMAVSNNRVSAALADLYREKHRSDMMTGESLDIVDTIMATVSMPGDDPITVAHKASRAPSFLGCRFTSPGDIDRGLIAAGLAGAITDRGLDGLAEFLLSDTARRVDGSVAWSEHAETIFLLTPGGCGEWLWQQVVTATSFYANGLQRPMDRARAARGAAAREHVRNLFEHLPRVIKGLVDAMDHYEYARSSTHFGVALMRSDFEAYVGEPEPGLRKLLQPALRFDTEADAAKALLSALNAGVSESDLLADALA